MSWLALLFVVKHATGSYGTAYDAAAAYSLAKLSSLIKTRWIDRTSPSAVLVPLAAAHATCIAGLVLLASVVHPGGWAFITLGAVLGLAEPALPETMRSYINRRFPAAADQETNQQSTRVDTLITEAAYGVGPVIVGAIATVAGPSAALAAVGVGTLAGTLAFTRLADIRSPKYWAPVVTNSGTPKADGHNHTPDTRAYAAADATRFRRIANRLAVIARAPMQQAQLSILMSVMFAWTFASTVVQVAITKSHHETVAGLLLGIGGLGSVVGGLWYLFQSTTSALGTAIARWCALFSLSLIAMAFLSSASALIAPLFAYGFLATCVVACIYKRAAQQDISGGPMTTGIQGLVLSSSIAGLAVGQFLGGQIAVLSGIRTALLVGAVVGLIGAAMARLHALR
jgi:predicted MFS family arabinose efflux permease